jgi:glycosyltransferase involved in cell wall biosynthesis
MRDWLEEEAASGRADVVHNHSLWMMPNVYAGRACRSGRGRLVVSPRGTLSPVALKISAREKKVFWRYLQASAVRDAVCFHATAESEYRDIRERGFSQPICVLPNGVDVPPALDRPAAGRKRLLFLGRLHPIKGIDNLLQAWAQVERQFPDWDLHVAGPDSRGHGETLRALAASLQLQRVSFRGPLFGREKHDAYRGASLFVLPSHSENFGMSIAEALAAGTPVVVSKGAPWSGLDEYGAGWWIDTGVEPLVACLRTALATPSARLSDMGAAGREWMARDFSWTRIGGQLSEVYRWLHEGGQVPACVRLH